MKEHVHFIPEIYEDELLYSFEYRLLRDNHYKHRKEFHQTIADNQIIHKDGFGYFLPLVEAMGWEGEQVEIYNKHTLYPITAIISNWQKQEHILSISRFGSNFSKVITPIKDEIKELKYCPLCLKEDPEFFIHKSHQLPGVKTCYKHRCLLHTLPKSRTGKELENIPQLTEPDYDFDLEELDYTKFIYELDALELDITSDELREIMADELKARGYENPYSTTRLKFNLEEKNIFASAKQIRSMVYTSNYMSASFLLKALYFTFESASRLNDAISEAYQDREIPETLSKALSMQNYTLLSPYKKNLMEVLDNTSKTSFLITEAGLMMFLGYKEEPLLSDQDRFDFMFKYVCDDEYKLVSDFISMTEDIKVKHKFCNRTYQITPRAFYYEGRRCPLCNSELHEKEAKQRVKNECPEFRLIKFTSPKEMCVFKHTKCGREFDYQYNKFFQKPYCKCCKPYTDNTESFKQTIEDLTGDEYELVDEYIDAKTKVKIKHNECGHVHSYGPAQFKRGQRCPKCSKIIPNKEFIKFVEKSTNYQYRIRDQVSPTDFIIEEIKTKDSKRMSKQYIIQELTRPTESEILPLSRKRIYKYIKQAEKELYKTNKKKVLDYIHKNINPNTIFNIDDLEIKSLNRGQVHAAIRALIESDDLVRISKNQYLWTDED
ncbi:TniQ family protein [Anaerococcus sp.]|uniref:TniQ family protein n=1 Tax=Anaerococcus sp. TaxID=1872515 RepID=UPI00280B4C4A|nr:TniQ family protein [Anaerococcus sp.]MDU3176681.1 TniQ family protein [Anaerococcus sp.]